MTKDELEEALTEVKEALENLGERFGQENVTLLLSIAIHDGDSVSGCEFSCGNPAGLLHLLNRLHDVVDENMKVDIEKVFGQLFDALKGAKERGQTTEEELADLLKGEDENGR